LNTHADKRQQNKSQANANELSQQQSGGESTFQFLDIRPEAIAQRKLQETANNNPRAVQFKLIQEMANNSPQVKQTAQFQAMAHAHTIPSVQKHGIEEALQMKADTVQKNENTTGLPDNLKSGIENLSGMSLDDVKVHRNSDKPAQLNAHAYAQGTDIHLGAGQEKHLPHEAWHVVQQKQGRVRPTLQMKEGVLVNDDSGLEQEADVMGAKALQRVSNEGAVENRISSPDPTQNNINQSLRMTVQHKQIANTFPPISQRQMGFFRPPMQGMHSTLIQRKFEPATIGSKSHLRADEVWGTKIGPAITANSEVLVDDNAANNKTTGRLLKTTWKPALNIDPTSQITDVPADQQGYIRGSRATLTGGSFEQILRDRIRVSLVDAEALHVGLGGHLNKNENIAWLLDKALRFDAWGKAGIATFATGFCSKEDKLTRINAGATYVAHSLDHWRRWLHGDRPNDVTYDEVTFVKSDLHEEGLGVMKVKFTKPLGPDGSKFSADTQVEVMIKPEDKNLEASLLGDEADSAANQINEIVGLSDPGEVLSTIRMACDHQFGSMVEKVRGTSAEDLGGADKPMTPAFHETLVFAFLAGLDDLHKENVFWDDGQPYMIDADNVLSYNQMILKDNGKLTQGGFGSSYNKGEAKKNKEAIDTGINTVNSKLLKTMIENPVKARKIIDVIQGAISGKTGRVVPISTARWGRTLKSYTTAQNKDGFLDFYANQAFIVREGKKFDPTFGPGLMGTSYKNLDSEFYSVGAERAELKKDLDSGVIPFYEVNYSTGHVTHNGTKIYHGQTLEQAMQIMIDTFSPFWDAQWDDYMRQREDEI